MSSAQEIVIKNCKGVERSLFSFSLRIGHYACHWTPWASVILHWAPHYFRSQFSVSVAVLCTVFSNSLLHDFYDNSYNSFSADTISMSTSQWLRILPSYATLSAHVLSSTLYAKALISHQPCSCSWWQKFSPIVATNWFECEALDLFTVIVWSLSVAGSHYLMAVDSVQNFVPWWTTVS